MSKMLQNNSIAMIDTLLMKSNKTEIERIDLEFSRLLTYRDFPMSSPMFPVRLAQAGFVYKNHQDEVHCFSCGLKYGQWKEGDDPFLIHNSSSPGCEYVQECGRMKGAYGGISDHKASRKPKSNVVSNLNQNENELPHENEKCLCNGSDIKNDRQSDINKKKIHEGMHQEKSEDVVAPLGIVQTQPRYSNYSILARRVGSYRNWPAHLRQQPEELAKAGLFYEGKNDSVRCFYCAGGLGSWEPEDDIWVEHARWFPKCIFVRQCKGDKFISDVLKGQIDYVTSGNNAEVGNSSEDLDDPAVTSVMEMGYSRDLTLKALSNLKSSGQKTSAETILQAVWEMEESTDLEPACENMEIENSEFTENHNTPIIDNVNNEINSELDSNALMRENLMLKEQLRCKICLDEDASIVFLPCGHLVSCTFCAPALQKCPVCRTHIKGTVKAIL